MPIIPTLDRSRQLYNQVNVSGRVSDAWCDDTVWTDNATRRIFERAGQRVHRPARAGLPVARRVVRDTVDAIQNTHDRVKFFTGTALVVHRAFMPLDALIQAERGIAPAQLAATLRTTPLFAFMNWSALAEALVGRANSGPLPPATNFLNFLARFHGLVSQHGLLGLVLEAAPLKAAKALESKGLVAGAAACVLGACLGRALLQPIRLAVNFWVLASAFALGSLVVAGSIVAELILRGLRDVTHRAEPLVGQLPNLNHMLDAGIFFANPLQMLREMRDLDQEVEALDQGRNDGRLDFRQPDINQSVNRRVNRLIALYFNRPQAVEDHEAGALADRIVVQIRAFCQAAPNDEAYIGGVASLQAFMAQGYEEAMWRPTPDILLERYVDQEFAALRAMVRPAQPHSLAEVYTAADALAAKILIDFSEVADTVPRDTCRARLMAMMNAVPGSDWRWPQAAQNA